MDRKGRLSSHFFQGRNVQGCLLFEFQEDKCICQVSGGRIANGYYVLTAVRNTNFENETFAITSEDV